MAEVVRRYELERDETGTVVRMWFAHRTRDKCREYIARHITACLLRCRDSLP